MQKKSVQRRRKSYLIGLEDFYSTISSQVAGCYCCWWILILDISFRCEQRMQSKRQNTIVIISTMQLGRMAKESFLPVDQQGWTFYVYNKPPFLQSSSHATYSYIMTTNGTIIYLSLVEVLACKKASATDGVHSNELRRYEITSTWTSANNYRVIISIALSDSPLLQRHVV